MKKYAIAGCLAVFALFLPSRCPASQDIAPTYTYQVAISSIIVNIVTVSTSAIGAGPGATQVDSPQLINRATIEIQNIDSAANLWCLAISTTPATNAGRKIAAGGSWIVSILDTLYQTSYSTSTGTSTSKVSAKFWCSSDGAAATKAAVTQLY